MKASIVTHLLAIAVSTVFYVTHAYIVLLGVLAISVVGSLFERGSPATERILSSMFVASLAVFIGIFVAFPVVVMTNYKPPGLYDPITELGFAFPFIAVPAGGIALLIGSTLQARKRA